MKNISNLFKYIKPYWAKASLNILFNILSVIFSLFSLIMVVPVLQLLFKINKSHTIDVSSGHHLAFNKKAITDYFYYHIGTMINTYDTARSLIFICVIIVVLFFLKNLFRYFAMYFLANVRNGVVKDIRNQIYHKILILPLSYYTEKKKGDLMSRMTNDVQEIENSIMSSLEMIFRDPLSIIIFLVTLFLINGYLTAFVLILLPITAYILGKIGKSLKRTSIKAQQHLGIILSSIEETISGLRIIKAFNAINISAEKFAEINYNYTRSSIRLYRKRDLASPLSEFLSTLVLVIIIWFGGRLVLSSSSSLDAEVFITYIVIFSQLIVPAKSFTTAIYNVQKGLASYERIYQVLEAEEVIIEKPNAIPINCFNCKIEYENVNFYYEKDIVLKKINLNIKKGKTIAIVGHSGSGKSTLVDLLPRFYDCTEGEIKIDSIPIKDYKIDHLRGLMGIVSQQTILFNDTVYNNIAFGRHDITPEQVYEAARIANADTFINQLSDKYNTYIGDSGCKLSGGEKQRLSIARAVLKNPPILILDEATSSLDSESEYLVQDAIFQLMEGRTFVIIAHRLSTIIHADEIFVINDGSIVEHGNHSELLDLNGYYKKLHLMQSFI